MPSPRDGTAGTLVSPNPPDQAQDADVADPGQVEKIKAEQLRLGKGKYGEVPVKPYKPGGDGAAGSQDGEDADGPPKVKSWIEVQMVDEDDNPVPGQPYRIELPDGTVADGTLDEKGLARIEGIDPGSCQISFPKLDSEAWTQA